MNSYTLKDIVLEKKGLLRGPFGGDLKKEIFVEKGKNTYKVYEQGVVLNSDKDIGRYYITEQDYLNKLNRFSVQDRDFLVSCSGVNNGAIYQLKAPFEKGIINQALLRIRLKNELIDDNYFYYLFKKLISRKITSGSGDSTIPNFPGLDVIKEIEFDLPDIKEQRVIGYLLSILDSKIELNNKINSELEVIAKTLYNYWFVQFDFPNKNRKPYKTSGGKMTWSEELKREIPEGWECLFLNDYLEFERGIEPGTANYFDSKETKNHIPFYKVGGMDGESKTWILKEIAGSSTAKEDDIFVSFDGTVGKLVIGISGAYSTGIRKIYQKKGYFPKAYVYFVFDSEEIQKTIKKYATGSNILHAGSSIDVLAVPYNKEVVEAFNGNVENIFLKLLQIKKENRELSELRDWLLPMLMNGQVIIK